MRLVKHPCPVNCTIHSHDGTYSLLATCCNCGEKHVAQFTKGTKPGHNDECPACGVPGHINYGTTQDVYREEEREKLIERSLAMVQGAGSQRRKWPWSRRATS